MGDSASAVWTDPRGRAPGRVLGGALCQGTLEPRGSGPVESPDSSMPRIRWALQKEQLQPSEFSFGKTAANGRTPGEGREEWTLYSPQLWAVSPFITNHLVYDESIQLSCFDPTAVCQPRRE